MIFRHLFAISFVITALTGAATALDTKARAALVLDFNTGTVLLEKNADMAIPPASMSKLMTLNMVFEALEDGRLSLDETLPVSEHAMSYGGSTMFLTTRDRVRVEDLILGVIVLSGNDACAVLAEALAGSEREFARVMTERAKQIGMTNSTFANSNGWPDPNQKMSARDLVTLATRLIRTFPQYYQYFAHTEFAFDNRAPDNRHNRNPLLKMGIGADGLKTGHTSEAGYGVVGSAVKGDRRIVIMVSGLDSEEDRAREAEKLMNWGFRQFVEKKILQAGQNVGSINLWLGRQGSVGLEVANEVSALLPVTTQNQLSGEIHLREPFQAPVEKGQTLGTMVLKVPDMPDIEVPLVASDSVERSGIFSRFKLSAVLLMSSLMDVVN
ncbi:MAG: D-alanyl-D-alanine carboxypeptidase family protein [Rhodobacterales bacterium]|nr:D-alanyl-D-alanine carboxypeptidase [Paracoccaceae bacterium]